MGQEAGLQPAASLPHKWISYPINMFEFQVFVIGGVVFFLGRATKEGVTSRGLTRNKSDKTQPGKKETRY